MTTIYGRSTLLDQRMSRRDVLAAMLAAGFTIGTLPFERTLANGDTGRPIIPPTVGVILASMTVPPADMPTILPAVAIWHVEVPPECGVHWDCTETPCTWVDAVHLLEGQYDCWFDGRVRLYRYGQTPCDLEPGSEFQIRAGDSFLALDRMRANSIVNPGPDPAREFTASIYASYPKIKQSIAMDEGIHVQPCGGLTPGEWSLMPDPPVVVTYRQVLMPPGCAFAMGDDELVFRYVDQGTVDRICLDADATILERASYAAGEPIAHRYWTPDGLHALTNTTTMPAILLEIAMTQAPEQENPSFLESIDRRGETS